MRRLQFENRETFTEYLQDQKSEMYEIICDGIREAHDRGDKDAYIVEIYLQEEETYIDMVSELSDWENSLTLAMDFYASIEEYEKCSSLKKLIESIKTLYGDML